MTEETRAVRQLWCAVILRAYRDVEALKEINRVPRSQQVSWQIKRVQEINLAGSPSAWLESERCREVMGMIGIER